MPCFDKKLEASRSDFYMPNAETREVDCVITSGTVITPIVVFVRMDSSVLFFLSIKGEVLKMLEEENVSLNDLESAAPDTMYVLFHFAFF